MYKKLLKSEKDIYKLFDEIYKIIPDSDINKAVYLNKKEQYLFQNTIDFPTKYPCIILYKLMKSNYSFYDKPHLNNKNHYFISDSELVYLNDFVDKNQHKRKKRIPTPVVIENLSDKDLLYIVDECQKDSIDEDSILRKLSIQYYGGDSLTQMLMVPLEILPVVAERMKSYSPNLK